MTQPLSGQIALITGANQGLGLAIATHYLEAGASLMLCARNQMLLDAVKIQLTPLVGKHQTLLIQAADVSKEAEVHSVVQATLQQLGGCHILVNNAGIYGPKGAIAAVAWEDWVKTIEINVYGSVLMCRALVPHFKQQKRGKIIQLSGGGATQPLPNLSAYAASKAAVVRFMETLAEELRGTGIDVNALAPGALNTKMLDEILEAGPEKVGQAYYDRALTQKAFGGASMEKAATLAVFLASSKSDGITGKLISAMWDNWEQWPAYLQELASTDLYTLRRIVGRDRACVWGDL